MSYAIRVISDSEGTRIFDITGVVPSGTYTINGHMPAEDTSPVASIGVQLTDSTNVHLIGAFGNCRLNK